MRVEHWLADANAGVRILRHAPGLSGAAILLIALVIGGNATVYSTINSILVSPASGVTRDDLVVIRHVDSSVALVDPFVSLPNFEDYARQSSTVGNFVAWNSQRATLGTATGDFAVSVGTVTTNYFDALGVPLARGRGLFDLDDNAVEGLAAVISHQVWLERFDGAEDAIGRPVSVNRVPVTIVGVAPPGFRGAALTPGEDLWVPIRAYSRATHQADQLTNRGRPFVLMAGRLNPAASLADATAEFSTLSGRLQATYPDALTTYSPKGVVALKNARAVVSRYSATALLPIGDMAPTFLAVFSIVTAITLIVVCANVANLLLGRAVERQRDTAVRRSLGASRGRIMRMLFAEGATLAVLASIAAIVMAWWMSRALLRIVEPVPGLLEHARPDWTLAAYGLTLAVAATIAFCLAPAVRSWRSEVLPLLKAGEHSIAGGRSRTASVLVVIQFAFSVLLITSAGLAYRYMTTLNSAELGFNPHNMLLVTVRLDRGSIDGTAAVDHATELVRLERVRERLSGVGGIAAVSYARRIPGATLLTAMPVRRDAQRAGTAFVRPVGPDYLGALGLSVLAGRELSAVDTRGSTRTAMISQRLAADLFDAGSPIGHEVFLGDREERVEIVGVVPDALFDGPSHDPRPRYLFVAEQQMPEHSRLDPSFIMRHQGPLEPVAQAVGRAIREADAGLPIVSMSTMNARLALVTGLETSIVQLLLWFAVMSLVIAAIGLYAIAMFNIRRRTREFGVRMALGASARRIQTSVIRDAMVLTVPGLLIGFALSAAVATAVGNMLAGVSSADPVTYAGVVVVLAVTSIVASYLPARSASRVKVVEALRQE